MTNKAKRNLFLALLVVEVIAYIIVIALHSKFDTITNWWIYISAAILFVILLMGWRNYSLAVKEDRKYGPLKSESETKRRK